MLKFLAAFLPVPSSWTISFIIQFLIIGVWFFVLFCYFTFPVTIRAQLPGLNWTYRKLTDQSLFTCSSFFAFIDRLFFLRADALRDKQNIIKERIVSQKEAQRGQTQKESPAINSDEDSDYEELFDWRAKKVFGHSQWQNCRVTERESCHRHVAVKELRLNGDVLGCCAMCVLDVFRLVVIVTLTPCDKVQHKLPSCCLLNFKIWLQSKLVNTRVS